MDIESTKFVRNKKVLGIIILVVIGISLNLLFSHKTPEVRVKEFIDEMVYVEDKTNVAELVQDYLDSVGYESPNEIYDAAKNAKKASLKTLKIVEKIDVPNNLPEGVSELLMESKQKLVRYYELLASAFDEAMSYYGGVQDIKYAYSFRTKFDEADRLLGEALDTLYVANALVEVEGKFKKQLAGNKEIEKDEITEVTSDPDTSVPRDTIETDSEQQLTKEEEKKQKAERAAQEEAKLAEQKRQEEEVAEQKRQEEAALAEQKRKEEEEKKRQAEIEAQKIAATQQEQKVFKSLSSKFISVLSSYKQAYEGNYGKLNYESRQGLSNELNTQYLIPLTALKEQLRGQSFQYVNPEPLRVGMVNLDASVSYLTSTYWINDSLRELNNATYSAYELGMNKSAMYSCSSSSETITNCTRQ
jgi:outer membrane biosynthesis protein TonB